MSKLRKYIVNLLNIFVLANDSITWIYFTLNVVLIKQCSKYSKLKQNAYGMI